jgi:hypothetical protein
MRLLQTADTTARLVFLAGDPILISREQKGSAVASATEQGVVIVRGRPARCGVGCVDSPSVSPSAMGARSGRSERVADPIASQILAGFPGSRVAGGHREGTPNLAPLMPETGEQTVMDRVGSSGGAQCRLSVGARGRRASAARSAPCAPKARLSQ